MFWQLIIHNLPYEGESQLAYITIYLIYYPIALQFKFTNDQDIPVYDWVSLIPILNYHKHMCISHTF